MAKICNRNNSDERYTLCHSFTKFTPWVFALLSLAWPSRWWQRVRVLLCGGAGRGGRLIQQSSSFTKILPRKVTTTSQNTPLAGTRHLIHKAVGEILNSNYNILPLTQMAHDHLLCPFSSYQRVHKISIVPTFF